MTKLTFELERDSDNTACGNVETTITENMVKFTVQGPHRAITISIENLRKIMKLVD